MNKNNGVNLIAFHCFLVLYSPVIVTV